MESTIASPSQIMPTGTCILVEGVLKPPAVEGKHVIELQADKILHIGTVDQEKYPLSKKRLPIDSLREFSHFKPRTTTVIFLLHPNYFLSKLMLLLSLEDNRGKVHKSLPFEDCSYVQFSL